MKEEDRVAARRKLEKKLHEELAEKLRQFRSVRGKKK